MSALIPKVLTIAIVYDQAEYEYLAGETVTGHVVLRVQEEVTLGGIRIYFSGKGRISWNSLASVNRAREIYLSEAKKILDSESSLYTSLNLIPGVHRYPFSLRLPANLPASYRGSHGYIRYKARVTVDGSGKGNQLCVESDFTVRRSVDLNQEPAKLRAPVEVRKEIDVSGSCYGSGSIIAEFVVNRRCFVPGEKILLNGNVEYLTNARVRRTTVAIVQKATLHKSQKKHVIRRTVSEVTGPVAPPYERGFWDRVALVVPSIPTSRMDGCNLIDIKYWIELSVAFALPCANVSTKLTSITIGNVPLQSSSAQSETAPRSSDTSVAASTTQRIRPRGGPPKTNTQISDSGSWGTQWDMIHWMPSSETDSEQSADSNVKPATDHKNADRGSGSGDGLPLTPIHEPTTAEIHEEPKRVTHDDH